MGFENFFVNSKFFWGVGAHHRHRKRATIPSQQTYRKCQTAVLKRFCGSSVVSIFETNRANEVRSFAFFEILAVKKNLDLKFFLKIFCQL
jgi:hypothetical protein